MKRAAFVALTACALLAGCADDAPEETAAPRPDLVLIVVDTLRADHLSTYGYERPTSPGLDDLAANGVVFDDATAQSSWTLPSMASMLSGRHLFVDAQRMPPGIPTLAERLTEEGYETVGFVGNAAVNAEGDYDRGFDAFVTRDDTGGVTWDLTHLERALTGWLDDNPPSDAPRFYYLHYLDPHHPYAPATDVDLDGTSTTRLDTIAAWRAERAERGAGDVFDVTFDAERAFVEAQVDAYDREIAATDASITRVLDRIFATRTDSAPGAPPHGATASDNARRADALSRHLVVIASDHGEVLWEQRHHPKKIDERPADERTLRHVFFRDHSYHMFQSLLNTPLIVAGAGFPRGRRVDRPVENVDIMPTLLRAAGVETPDEGLDGAPLQDALGDEPPAPRLLFAHSNEGTMVRAPGGVEGVDAAGDWKLVFPTDTGFSFGMPIQLYDLSDDGRERRNVYDEQPQVAGELLGVHKDVIEGFDLFDGHAFGASEANKKVLEDLGYLTDEKATGDPAARDEDDHR